MRERNSTLTPILAALLVMGCAPNFSPTGWIGIYPRAHADSAIITLDEIAIREHFHQVDKKREITVLQNGLIFQYIRLYLWEEQPTFSMGVWRSIDGAAISISLSDSSIGGYRFNGKACIEYIHMAEQIRKAYPDAFIRGVLSSCDQSPG